MNAKQAERALLEVLAGAREYVANEAETAQDFGVFSTDVRSVATFKDAGVLTRDRGIVLRMRDGSCVYFTINTLQD